MLRWNLFDCWNFDGKKLSILRFFEFLRRWEDLKEFEREILRESESEKKRIREWEIEREKENRIEREKNENEKRMRE